MGNVAVTILLMLLFLLFLFLTLAAPQLQAQNTTPATARQAVDMPQFAARLARNASRMPHGDRPQASYKNHSGTRPDGLLPTDDVVYSNGPINGTTDAWTINFGFMVSDTFPVVNCSPGYGQHCLTALSFGAWVFPGDTLQSVEVSITSGPFNQGTRYFDGIVNFTQSGCIGNQYGFNVCTETGNFAVDSLAQGTYWVSLQNATVNTGDPIYWDENSGPSLGDENSVGTIPSEAFTLLGNTGSSTCPPSTCFLPGCAQDTGDFQIVHNFSGSDPAPYYGLAIDRAANVYGTTPGGDGMGSVYQLALRGTNWIYTSLFSFLGGENGQTPRGEIVGPDGALYGFASGGIQNCGYYNDQYCGIIYRLSPSLSPCLGGACNWRQDTIYEFTSNSDLPSGRLVAVGAGGVYGSTFAGGAYGQGTIYKLSSVNGGWTRTNIYNFTGGYDGAGPSLTLLGHDGYLYGGSTAGFFRLSPSGRNALVKVLAAGNCGPEIQDSAGNFYCRTTDRYDDRNIWGKIYKLSYGDWTWSLVEDLEPHYQCTDFNDICYDVFNSLAADAAGGVYVTQGTQYHRYHPECHDYVFTCDGNTHRVGHRDQQLVDFHLDVFRDLEIDTNGNLYGTTGACGNSRGTVWQLTPP
jgi:hypothetical protein